MEQKIEMTREIAQKVLQTVDAGLVSGMGEPTPGKMCVEAAVCFALGLPHSDNPPCVSKAVRAFKIRLNDSAWSSDEARTKGLRMLAVAQLGSEHIDDMEFAKQIAEQVIRQILPIALRAAASVQKDKKNKTALENAAVECEKNGDRKTALEAKGVACAAYAADDAAYAADAAAYAAAAAAADAAKRASIKDDILTLMAKIGVEVLQRFGSQGCQWLDLVK